MTDHRSNERIFELIISDALADLWDKELEEIYNDEPIEQHDFSKGFERNINKIRRSIGRKERIQGICKVLIKVLVIAAAVMGIAFGGLLTHPKIYADVLEVIRSITSTHDSYEYQVSNTAENLDFDKSISPRYIPQGFTIRFIYYADNDVSMTYDNADGEEIRLSYGSFYNSKISIDNERSQLFEFKRDEITYYYYQALEEDKFSTMLWYKDDYYFVITAQISEEEFVKIAESIE